MLLRILKSFFYKQARKQAQKLRGDKKGKERVIDDAEKKAGRFARMKGRFVKFYAKLSLILRMLRAYISGEYRKLPWTAVFRLLTAIIYFVAIVDFIPDFIPLFGFLDDMAVLTWVLASLKVEAGRFLEWEEQQNADRKESEKKETGKKTEKPVPVKKPLPKKHKAQAGKKPLPAKPIVKRKMSAQKQNLRIAEHNIPVNIYVERRRNVRASIVKSGVNIRIPFFFSAAETEKTIHRLKDWAFKKIESSTALQNKLYPRSYYSGQKIRVQEQEFTLNLEQANRKSFSGKIKGDTIFISLPEDATAEEQSQFLPRLISNLMSKCFYQRTFNRVEAINQKYFGKKIKRFSLKYTASIWGSCSGRGGITLSSRLLLAPQEALDYVIVHELAHFEHPNHSAAFWNEVARVMPNYQEQEKWLKKNGHLCDF